MSIKLSQQGPNKFEKKLKKWVQFGWASGALVTTLLTDYAQPADEDQIWSIWEGNARVKR